MLRSAASKVAWVGRTTSMVFGLALVMALVLGLAATAWSATGGNFILGKKNAATTPTSLVSTLADAAKSALMVQNKSGGAALDLRVGNATTPANNVAPMKVNSTARVANLNADLLDGKSEADFYAAGSKVADSSHADNADSATTATNAGDADQLDGKSSEQFANATHPHSGADITSGTVEADRVEDGAGSNLNADQLDGLNSTDLTVGMATASGLGNNPSATMDFLATPAQVTVAAGQAVHVTSNRAFGSTVSGGGVDLRLYICHRSTSAPAGTAPTQWGGGAFGLSVSQNERNLMGLSWVIPAGALAAGTYHVGLCGHSTQPTTWNNNEWGYTTAMVVKPSAG